MIFIKISPSVSAKIEGVQNTITTRGCTDETVYKCRQDNTPTLVSLDRYSVCYPLLYHRKFVNASATEMDATTTLALPPDLRLMCNLVL